MTLLGHVQRTTPIQLSRHVSLPRLLLDGVRDMRIALLVISYSLPIQHIDMVFSLLETMDRRESNMVLFINGRNCAETFSMFQICFEWAFTTMNSCLYPNDQAEHIFEIPHRCPETEPTPSRYFYRTIPG